MSPLKTYDTFSVGTTAKRIDAAADNQKKISAASAAIFWKNKSDVGTGDTEVAAGGNVVTEETIWIISKVESVVFVEYLEAPTHQDLTVTDDLVVTDDLTVKGLAKVTETLGVTGATTVTGGVVSSGAVTGAWAGGFVPTAAADGTDTAVAEKKLFLASIFLPANKTLTGIGFMVGSVGAKGKVVLGLFNAAGEVLAKSTETTEGTTTGAAAAFQEVDFTATYAATGPRLYYIGVTGNNAEDKLRTIAVGGKTIYAGEVELAAKQVLAKVTAPTTFTASKGPVGYLF